MIDSHQFYSALYSAGVRFVTGVPDSRLNEFCRYAAAELPPDRHVIAANEGNAVALAAGYHLASGGIPLVYMQNSGLGNATNPLLSLTNREMYSIPMVLLIGWRGDPSVPDHAQHLKQGALTPFMLEAMDIPYRILKGDSAGAMAAAAWAVNTSRETSTPTALIAQKGVFEKARKDVVVDDTSPFPMSREQAMECVLDLVPRDALFVASTGRAARELHALRDVRGENHASDFLNVGAMGHTSSIAAGAALGSEGRLVICFDGDAALLMHLGALSVIGSLETINLLHVILNNGAHESVGGQPTTAFHTNLTAVAHAAGYHTIEGGVSERTDICRAIKKLLEQPGPRFLEIRVYKGIRSDLPPLHLSHFSSKTRFLEVARPRLESLSSGRTC